MVCYRDRGRAGQGQGGNAGQRASGRELGRGAPCWPAIMGTMGCWTGQWGTHRHLAGSCAQLYACHCMLVVWGGWEWQPHTWKCVCQSSLNTSWSCTLIKVVVGEWQVTLGIIRIRSDMPLGVCSLEQLESVPTTLITAAVSALPVARRREAVLYARTGQYQRSERIHFVFMHSCPCSHMRLMRP